MDWRCSSSGRGPVCKKEALRSNSSPTKEERKEVRKGGREERKRERKPEREKERKKIQ
jgi:hypothetical protein